MGYKKVRKIFPFSEKYLKMQLQPCCAVPTILSCKAVLTSVKQEKGIWHSQGNGLN